ncbi:restriction endonuclease subunit S [Agromyces protaetiae]|uniref:Restriction endonuclease subunit S n=1 Tax=Agromyces protaetiae TaxID=2509455 RepID=A0A4P6FGH2_9MICO|nr:restriction endonuclease subunit S [Agromyces protaetiae]
MFEGAGNKTTIPNLSRNRLAALHVPFPQLAEQQAIVAVLGAAREGVGIQERLVHGVESLHASALRDLFALGLRGEETKDSEIGPIPWSWQMKSIGELCQIWSGGTPRKAVPEFWGGDIPWVSGKDLKRPVLEDAVDHLSVEGVESGSRLAPEEAVLLLVRGMGLAKDLPVAAISRPMAFNQDVKALVVKDEFSELSGHFLRSAIYAGKSRLLSQIVSSAHGTMTLNLNDVENLQVALPTDAGELHEIDRTICAIETKVDVHRRKAAALNELYLRLLRGLMTGEVTSDQLAVPDETIGSAA